MTEPQLASWLKRHGYVDAALTPWGRGWVHVMVNPQNLSENVRMIVSGTGNAELVRDGVDVTWIAELELIPESPPGTRSKRYEHYLKHGRVGQRVRD